MRAPGDAIGILALECAMDELAETLGLDPVELRLRNDTEIDPERHIPFASRHLAEALRQGEIVYRVDGMKNFCGTCGFVALQVADQMPGGLQVFKLGALPFPFLDAIFSEVVEAGFVGFTDGLGGMSF